MTTTTSTRVQSDTATDTVVVPSSPEGKADVAASPKSPSPMSQVNALYRHEGALTGDDLASALALALSAREREAGADLAVRGGEEQVTALTAALAEARGAVRQATADRAEARVIVARVLYLVTTRDVLGQKSIDASEVAKAWGVSKQYVSQQVAAGRAMHAMGSHSTATFATVDRVRRQGAKALAALTDGAVKAATERARRDNLEGAVKVSADDIAAAAEAVAPTAPAEDAPTPKVLGEVKVSAITRQARNMIDTLKAASKDGRLIGTEEDKRHALAAVAALTEALRYISPEAPQA